MSGCSHNNIMNDCLVVAWLIPSAKDNQGVMDLHKWKGTLSLHLDTWKLLISSSPAPKRACSDPDRLSVLVVNIGMPFVQVQEKHLGKDELVLSIGNTQLGSKKADNSSKEFTANIRCILDSFDKKDEKDKKTAKSQTNVQGPGKK